MLLCIMKFVQYQVIASLAVANEVVMYNKECNLNRVNSTL